MTAKRLELLRKIRDGRHPLAGVYGRALGQCVRSLEVLRAQGFLHRYRGERFRSSAYRLTRLARDLLAAADPGC